VRLLIVGTPCFGLDAKTVAEVWVRIMAARNAGAAVLLVSEDLDDILEPADRIVVMHGGKVVHETAAAGHQRAVHRRA
jgi:simple sugar transport system ATP-binding protein